MTFKKIIRIIILILIAIFIGTVLDYFVHQMSSRFSVPSSYFTHKVFYGTLWASLSFFVGRRFISKNWLDLAFISAFITAVLLQVVYYVQGHLATDVVILFVVLHFFMFLIPMIFLFKKYKNLLV